MNNKNNAIEQLQHCSEYLNVSFKNLYAKYIFSWREYLPLRSLMKNIAKRFIITVAHLERIYKYQCIY